MKLKVKLNKGVEAPQYQTKGAAGFDLAADRDYLIRNVNADGVVMVSTGVSVAIPEGYVGKLYVRSYMVKTPLRMANAVGIIDSDFRGVIHVPLEIHMRATHVIKKGERIAQLVISKIEQPTIEVVDKLEATERGAGGFGSTGKRTRKSKVSTTTLELREDQEDA